MLTLDAEHIYRLDGEVFPGPSVTEVIKAAGFMGYLPEDQYYLDRGTYVHEAIALYLKGQLDFGSLSEGIKPFVDSAIEYITITGYKAEHVELSLYDPVYMYCGTIDTLPLRDWKNSHHQPWHSIQISSYYNLALVNDLKPELPCTVHLSDKGKMAKAEPYTAARIYDDRKTFFSALHCYQWRKNNGLIKEKAS